MPNRKPTERRSTTKSGVMPRPVLEPENRREPPRPPTIPEMAEDDGATTGKQPAVREGDDSSAVGDDDHVYGSL